MIDPQELINTCYKLVPQTTQDYRREADYDPNASITRTRTLNIIAQANTAIRDFAQLPQEERRLLAAQSMFDRR